VTFEAARVEVRPEGIYVVIDVPTEAVALVERLAGDRWRFLDRWCSCPVTTPARLVVDEAFCDACDRPVRPADPALPLSTCDDGSDLLIGEGR
jgi:hypothetical protein